MRISEQFPSRFIKGHDLKNKEVTITIKSCYTDRIGKDEKEELILSFEESAREMVLNRTNAHSISEIHGDETDDWAGKQIVLYPTKVQAFGKSHEVIRVRPTASTNGDNPFEGLDDFSDTDAF